MTSLAALYPRDMPAPYHRPAADLPPDLAVIRAGRTTPPAEIRRQAIEALQAGRAVHVFADTAGASALVFKARPTWRGFWACEHSGSACRGPSPEVVVDAAMRKMGGLFE